MCIYAWIAHSHQKSKVRSNNTFKERSNNAFLCGILFTAACNCYCAVTLLDLSTVNKILLPLKCGYLISLFFVIKQTVEFIVTYCKKFYKTYCKSARMLYLPLKQSFIWYLYIYLQYCIVSNFHNPTLKYNNILHNCPTIKHSSYYSV